MTKSRAPYSGELIRAVEQMVQKGLVTSPVLGQLWKVSESTMRRYIRSQNGNAVTESLMSSRVWHRATKKWFYPKDLMRPEPLKALVPVRRRRRKTGKAKYERPEFIRQHYRGDSTPPGREQVRLESAWAMWPAPGFIHVPILGITKHYMVTASKSYGWFGA